MRKENYVKIINKHTRYIGKTYTLIQLAKKYKCPIFVPSEETGNYIKQECKYRNIKNVDIITCNNFLRGKKFSVGLCEEGIGRNLIREILFPICNCLVGFYNEDTILTPVTISEYKDWRSKYR